MKFMSIKQISVLGGGSWGTILSNLSCKQGIETLLWMRDKNIAQEINTKKENNKYLPGYKLQENLKATTDIEDISNSDLIIFCIPSDSFRDVVVKSKEFIKPNAYLVSATKGVEPEGFKLMSQVLVEELNKELATGVLSGPNLANEISKGQLTGTVIASNYEKLNSDFTDIFSTDSFRVYTSTDPFGVELGGALKNIYAIACGMADGLNAGENTVGMIMTRGLAEMSRFAVKLGSDPMTFLGLSGVGDLITTCASPLSRNHQIGKLIGRGSSVEEAKKITGQTAEGIKTLKVVWEESRKQKVEMPIVEALYKIIFEEEPLGNSMEKVLGTNQGKDVEFSRKV